MIFQVYGVEVGTKNQSKFGQQFKPKMDCLFASIFGGFVGGKLGCKIEPRAKKKSIEKRIEKVIKKKVRLGGLQGVGSTHGTRRGVDPGTP